MQTKETLICFRKHLSETLFETLHFAVVVHAFACLLQDGRKIRFKSISCVLPSLYYYPPPNSATVPPHPAAYTSWNEYTLRRVKINEYIVKSRYLAPGNKTKRKRFSSILCAPVL